MESSQLVDLVERLRSIGTDTMDVEVKSAAHELPRRLARTVSSFANTHGGTIILGLDESTDFTLVDGFKAKNMADSLATVCRDHVTPSISPDIDIVDFEDGQVVVGAIPALAPREQPCYVTAQGKYNGSYTRAHDGNRNLKPYEIDRLEENRQQPEWDLEIVPDATVEDLDREIIEALLGRERTVHGRIFARMSDEDALINLHVLRETADGDVRPTIAGLLTTGIYPQRFFPRLNFTFSSYPGDSKATGLNNQRFLDNQSFVGPIPTLIHDCVDAVQRNSRIGGVIDGIFRKDLPDYPPVAVREAITNALMHRDYSPQARGAQVQVDMYPDRLEIFNPGGLYGMVTEDTLGKAGVSSTRNQYLSQLLESCPYPGGGYVAENRGSGYQEILSQLDQQLLPPPIPKDSLTGFRLTFPMRKPTAPEKRAHDTVTSRDRIIEHASTHATASSRELAAAAGISVSGARRILQELVGEGILERTQPLRSPKQRYKLHR